MRAEKRSGGVTRLRIVEGAERVIARRGLAGATTKEIAKAAGCAEGTLYVHFRHQIQIFAAVFERHLPAAVEALNTLRLQAGEGDVIDNLLAMLLRVRSFLERVMPILAGALADPALGKVFRATWKEFGFGPQNFVARVAAFVRAEQERGRIPRGTNADVASEALLGFIFYSTFTANLLKDRDAAAYRALLRDLVRANLFVR